MKSHYAMAFVAASTVLVLSQPAAMARTRSHAHHHVQNAPRPVAYHPEPGESWIGEDGKASYYSSRYNGRVTSSGARFNQTELTAAHAWLPFGTKVRVFCADTGRTVVVTVTDRIYSNRRVLDLSRSAAEQLGIIRRGVAKVSLTPV
jgi:rare lipoprotein A